MTNKISIREEIKGILKAGNSYYYSAHTLLSSGLHSKNLKIKINKIITFAVVLYGCETWSLILRDISNVKVSENRILRRIFGPKRDANGEWRRFHNEELHSLYRSPNVRVIKSRRLRWAGHVARIEEDGSAFKILIGKRTGRRPLRRPWRIWEVNIRMNLKEIGVNARNWVDSAQDRDYWRNPVNAILNLRVS